MAATAILLLTAFAQGQGILDVGKPIEGSIDAESPVVNTPTLDANYTNAPTVGNSYRVEVSKSGPYTIKLHSYAFDGYLVLFEENGELLVENDDGLIGAHALIAIDLKPNRQYSIHACALHGKVGEFQLELSAGKPAQLSQEEKWLANEADQKAHLQFIESRKGKLTLLYAGRERALAGQYLDAREFEKAESHWKSVVDAYQKILGNDHALTAYSMEQLARAFEGQGEWAEARAHHILAIEINERASGPDDIQSAAMLNSLAGALLRLGEYKEAQSAMERSIRICTKVFGPDHSNTGFCHFTLGQALRMSGDFRAARIQLGRALVIWEGSLGKEHPQNALALDQLGMLSREEGDFEEARALFERACQIYEKELGSIHPSTAVLQVQIARTYLDQGRFAKAQQLNDKAFEILEGSLPFVHEDIATSLELSTAVYWQQGALQKAREFCEKALEVREKLSGQGNVSFATDLDLLANILQDQGNLDGALECYERSLAISETLLGKSSANTLNNLGVLIWEMGELDKAQQYLERSLALWEEQLGKDHPHVGTAMGNLAAILADQGEVEASFKLEVQALEIRRKAFGDEDYRTALGMQNLAKHFRDRGKYEQAAPLFEQALIVYENSVGSDHPNATTAFKGYARLLKLQGQFDKASAISAQGLLAALDRLDRELPTMSESGRFLALDRSMAPGILFESLVESDIADMSPYYSVFKRWKGMATRMQTATVTLGQSNHDYAIRNKKSEIQAIAKELSNLILLPKTEQAANHLDLIRSLRKARIEAEREFNRALGLDATLDTPSLAKVQSGMLDRSVLVDIFVNKNVYAWILKPEGNPTLLFLGKAETMRKAQEEFLQTTAVRGGSNLSAASASVSAKYYSMLWGPIKNATGEVDTVFISPDGFLCELPFGVLQSAEGAFLLENHRFFYLCDPNQLANAAESKSVVEGELLAVGGVNYFRRDDLSESVTSRPSTRSRVGESWSSLPATRDELQSLRDLHDYILEWKSRMVQVEGKAATEERIRLELPGKRYVHIATHGYFEPDHLPSLLLDAEEKESKPQLGEQMQAVGLLPGLLSGLVFAGVNGEHDPTRDDGYLSAEEIQHLDLSACDLVVLSACETALGSARAGEGLMSLRRAFSVAGADTVISSLWKVDDKATAQLMKDFYTNLWEKSMSRGDALHEAKLRMLRRNRIDNGGDAMPSTWGAFVLSGEWN